MITPLPSDIKALQSAMGVIGRDPEAQKLQEAATNIHSPAAVAHMRELVRGNFARLNSGEKKDAEAAVTDVAEAADENSELQVYREQYDSLPDSVKMCLDWSTLVTRLTANNGEKLQQLRNMPRGAQLFGVDNERRALFKNKGEEPVMFAFNDGEMVVIPERDSDEFRAIQPLADNNTGKARWAAYGDVRPWAKEHGYEFLPCGSSDEKYFSSEMKQVTGNTDQEFLVASANGKDYRSVWLESGDNPVLVPRAVFVPVVRVVGVGGIHPEVADNVLGAALLLRV